MDESSVYKFRVYLSIKLTEYTSTINTTVYWFHEHENVATFFDQSWSHSGHTSGMKIKLYFQIHVVVKFRSQCL